VTAPEPAGTTRVACLTPPGTGAIATLALRGPEAWNVLREVFTPAKGTGKQLPPEAAKGQVWFGLIRRGQGDFPGEEIVATLVQQTPDPWVEVHCHGGREVVRSLLEMFGTQGVQVCSWQELEQRTEVEPSRAAALAALVEARTTRTAAILLEQYHGAFTRALAAVRTALQETDCTRAEVFLRDLLRYTGVGRHLTAGWQVVVAGAPNVGKSSLVNALAGHERSVVACTPGTTRDIVTTTIAVDGWLVELADTAGLRDEAVGLELMGRERVYRTAGQADLCLWVLDCTTQPVWPGFSSRNIRYVINKKDLPAADGFTAPPGAMSVSAKTGAGLDILSKAIAHWLIPEPPPAGAALPFTSSLCAKVEEMHRYCLEGCPAEAGRVLESLWE
jgi:tRNA modification GTPase